MAGNASFHWLSTSYGTISICSNIAKTKLLRDVCPMNKFLASFPFVIIMHLKDLLMEENPLRKFSNVVSTGQPYLRMPMTIIYDACIVNN